jgi:transposase
LNHTSSQSETHPSQQPFRIAGNPPLAAAIWNCWRRARDQLLTFVDWPGQVGPTNNACERDLRPAVIQRKVTNGYRAMWAAQGEADVRTVVDTARLAPNTSVFGTILTTVTA